VTVAAFPIIDNAQLDTICRLLADAATHKELTLLFKDARIPEVVPSNEHPKWERMLTALTARQQLDHSANAVLSFIARVLAPRRFQGRPEAFAAFRNEVNVQLAFLGAHLGEDGKMRRARPATTLDEAERRASEMREELRRRLVHEDVLHFCRAELMRQDYFHCVLEAAKSVAAKIRTRTGLSGDGAVLVDEVFAVKIPLLALNSLRTESERSEQSGFANLLKGIFGVFRNPTAHEARVRWAVEKADALDALTIISYAHRRLDEAVIVPGRGPSGRGTASTS
jgi:uncharacterized protein (TIGR02391 family)